MGAPDQIPPPPIECVISEQRSGGHVEIVAEIRAQTIQSGSYRLQVVKQGPSGDSQVNQQSEFALGADGAIHISALKLSMEPSARYRAVLVVTAGHASYTCERRGPDKIDQL